MELKKTSMLKRQFCGLDLTTALSVQHVYVCSEYI